MYLVHRVVRDRQKCQHTRNEIVNFIFHSRERQKQLDELSKELARVTKETETLKAALRSTKGKTKMDEVS